MNPQIKFAREPGFLKFHVSSAHAEYDVDGLAPFKKLLHEVEVVETIKNGFEGSSLVGGAVDSVTGTGKGLYNLVAHPVDSVKGVGKASTRLGRSIGRAFRPKQEGEDAPFEEKVFGHWERQVAKDLGVDIYTTNPYLKEILTEKAKGRAGGKGAVMVGKLFIPGGILVSATLAAGDINTTADRVVNDESRPELFRANQEALQALGFTEGEARQLLNNLFFTPREATYMRFYLDKLQRVRGYRCIMKEAMRAKSLWQARKILYAGQMTADSFRDTDPFTRLECFPEGIAVEDRNRAILITPYDYLEESALGDHVLEKVLEMQGNWQKPAAEIWNGGNVTTGFLVESQDRGVKARTWQLF